MTVAVTTFHLRVYPGVFANNPLNMYYGWNSRSYWDLDECDDMGAKKKKLKYYLMGSRAGGCVLLLCSISICILSRIADSCTTWCCAYHHAEPGALAPASAGTQTLHRGFWDFPFDSTTRQTFQKAAAAFRCTFITPQKKKKKLSSEYSIQHILCFHTVFSPLLLTMCTQRGSALWCVWRCQHRALP